MEACHFLAGIDVYLAGGCRAQPHVDDVYAERQGGRQVITVLMKVFAHWLFRLLGRFADRRIRASGISIYRKAYVDDIELVFNIGQADVVRAVYPFPINLNRQVRYLKFLGGKGYLFKLTGNPYSIADLVRFLCRRDVRSLSRLESRAQIRHAHEVAALGITQVQLSDEFDIGSLDFARTLARLHVYVVNSAHGIGKYIPVHAYDEFHVLAWRQKEYYIATRTCRYCLRTLNGKAAVVAAGKPSGARAKKYPVSFVFLSGQSSHGVGETYLVSNEAMAVERLGKDFAGSSQVRLLYRPHPNNLKPVVPYGFELLPGLEEVNGQPGTVFASYCSTCQIDPAFKGRKILLRGEMIYPEVWFDDSEEMRDLDQLVGLLRELGSGSNINRTSCSETRRTASVSGLDR